MSAPQLWTFGHSTRSEGDTVTLLREFAITTVVDVRSIRGSRYNPQFGAEVMETWLPEAGCEFTSIANLGGRRRPRGIDPGINAGWKNDSFHSYADWTLTDEFERGLDELVAIADMTRSGGRPTAIMCAEAVPWRCHRSLIATVLTMRGWHVEHILGPGQCVTHEPGRWGATPMLRSDGHIVYPASDA